MDIVQRVVTHRAVQRIVNTKQLSAFFGWLANLRLPHFLLRRIIQNFAASNGSSLSAYDFDIEKVATFNQFFTRRFQVGARPFAGAIAAPAEAFCSIFGVIEAGLLYQIKGKSYPMRTLLGQETGLNSGGSYLTLYLSPADYHGVHAPFDSTIHSVRYISGDLHSVNAQNIRQKDNIYCTNERIVLSGVSEFGVFYMILVGAVIVGKIKLHIIKDCKSGNCYENLHIACKQGDELAMFELGSTVILILPTLHLASLPLSENEKVKLGQKLC